MKGKRRNKNRKNYIYLIFIIFSALAFYYVINNIYKEKIEDYKKFKIDELKLSYDIIINSYKQSSQIVFNEVINKPEIWSILEDANSNNPEKVDKARQKLLSKFSSTYKRLEKLDVRQLHFHLANNRSFLRFHRPLKYGDDLTDIRYSIKMTNLELKPNFGFEEGKIYYGFRNVFPIVSKQNKHLGSVEISFDFNLIKKELFKILPNDYYFLVNKDIIIKKLFASEIKNYKQSFLHDKFMYDKYVKISETAKTINKTIKKEISNTLEKFNPIVLHCKCIDENYIVSFLPILNVEGNKSAYIVSYEKDNIIEDINRIYYLILFAVLVFFIIIFSLVFRINKNNLKLIRNEGKLKQNLEFEELISSISSNFVGIFDLDKSINSLLKSIGEFFHAERSYIFIIDKKFNTLNNTNEWCNKGIKPKTNNFQNLNIKSFDFCLNKLKNSEAICYRDVSEIPNDANINLDFFESRNVKSIVVLPLKIEGNLYGFIGFDNVLKKNMFTDESMKILRIASEILVNSIQRIKSEEKLKESEDRFKMLSVSTFEGILIHKNGVLIDVNQSFLEMVGYTEEEAIGKNLLDFIPIPKDVELVKMNLSKSKSEPYNISLNNKKGENFTAEIEGRDVVTKNGIIRIAAVRDVTERIKSEKLIKKQNIELKKRNEDLDAFSHTVAHDLKNPLGNIMGFAEILSENYSELDNDTINDYLKMIINDGNKTQDIINSLLLFASVRKANYISERINMSSVIEESINRLKLMIEKTQAEIKISDDFPEVCAYPLWIEEVWVNFISNALKYGGKPPLIEIGYKFEENNMVRFWIKDNGPGISPENQKLLFKKFERFNTANAEGHGLGLSIVYRIIDKLGGKVGFNSKPNNGSCFYFTLPLYCEEK